jgi:FkbM family methyltransferase
MPTRSIDLITIAPASDPGVLRRELIARNPFRVVSLPMLSRLHRVAFQPDRRASKLFIGKPAKLLFRLLMASGAGGWGRFSVELADGRREVAFNARNTQFGALYQPHFQPVYEPETSALLDLLLADDGCFVDAGANWGWYSLLLASRPGFAGTIHAFEPFPATFADLQRVVRQAGLEHRITCHNVALGEHEGSVGMTIPGGMLSGLARIGQQGGTAVRQVPMDSLALPPPDVIKIDVEDQEIAVLRGAPATIEQARPYVVFENWATRERPAMTLEPFRWFAARDYRFFHAGWVGGAPDYIVPELPDGSAGRGTLALLPFLPAQRFYLPPQLNVLAVPAERLDDLRCRIEGSAAGAPV